MLKSEQETFKAKYQLLLLQTLVVKKDLLYKMQFLE